MKSNAELAMCLPHLTLQQDGGGVTPGRNGRPRRRRERKLIAPGGSLGRRQNESSHRRSCATNAGGMNPGHTAWCKCAGYAAAEPIAHSTDNDSRRRAAAI